MSNRIFVRIDNKQEGPFDRAAIREKLSSDLITPATMAWHPGLKNWTPLRNILSQSPDEAENDEDIAMAYRTESGTGEASLGFGRLGYFIFVGGSLFITYLTFTRVTPTWHNQQIAGAILLVIFLFAGAQRLRNIGLSGWLTFLAFIPVIPILCLFAPGNFAVTKRLDKPAFFVLMLLALALAVVVERYFW